MDTEALKGLVQQIGDSGGILVLLVPALVQVLKKIPFIVKLQENKFPAYELLALALSVGGAHVLGLPNAIVTGVIAWLAAEKGYDYAKGKTVELPK
jgi:hypothetical protein